MMTWTSTMNGRIHSQLLFLLLLMMSPFIISARQYHFSDEDKERAVSAIPDISFEEFGYGLATYMTKKKQERFQENLRADDIMIVSFPKSGTNWVKQIVHLIRLRADPSQIAKYADKDLSELINIPEAIANFDFDAVDSPKPRAFFSHSPWDDVPKGCKIIYIARNPADVAPSFYKYVKTIGPNFREHDVNDVAQLLVDGLLYTGNWELHVADYWSRREDPNVLFLKFEDLKQDHAGQVVRIADFMQIPLTSAQVTRVVEMSSFEYMKRHSGKIQGKEWATKVTGQKIADEYTLVSDGKSGKKELSKEMENVMETFFREKAGPLLGDIDTYSELEALSVSSHTHEHNDL